MKDYTGTTIRLTKDAQGWNAQQSYPKGSRRRGVGMNLKRHLVQWYDLDTFAFTTACGRTFERDTPLGADDTYETERTTTQAERIECGNCRRSLLGRIVIQRSLN